MRIGVDFDNTIVCYDDVFHRLAVDRGLVPTSLEASKTQVRRHLCGTGRENDWTEIQGEVYGNRMAAVVAYPGALACLAAWRHRSVPVMIISHKMRFPHRGPSYDLHQAARSWLEQHGFFDPQRIGLARDQVFFELTREEKLRRIAVARCTHFIDDLPDLLAEPAFPPAVQRILFDPHQVHGDDARWQRIASWTDLQSMFLPATSGSAARP